MVQDEKNPEEIKENTVLKMDLISKSSWSKNAGFQPREQKQEGEKKKFAGF